MKTTTTALDYVFTLSEERATLETVGGKGASLARLVREGLPVPDGFHVTTEAYRYFVTENHLQPAILEALALVDISQPSSLEKTSTTIRTLFLEAKTPPEVASAIALAYADLAGRDPVVAVRSSATAEDLPDASFAGQQETFLNVKGAAEVLDAVKRCWASLWTARAIGYRARQGIGPEGISLAVVVQALVPAEAAGILFTANPVTGRRDQAMISASWGLGEAVVGGLVTPDTILVSKRDGAILERQVADKQVMTVRINGGTEEGLVPEELRHAPAIDDHVAVELVHFGVRIETLYGMPMDIEWALADGKLAIVQARPITALPPEPIVPGETAEPPTEWSMPNPKGPYMRSSIADFMPDPLTPLFKSLAVVTINAAMGRTMSELIGSYTAGLANYLSTINDYAYLYVNLGWRDWMWVLFRMIPAVPRLMREAENHYREVACPRYAAVVDHWRRRQLSDMSGTELLNGIQALTAAMGDYLTALQVDAIGAAAGTEGVFTAVYDKLIKREGDPPAATLLLGANSKPIQAEKALFDLASWCRERDSLASWLLDTPSAKIAAIIKGREDSPAGDGWEEFHSRFQNYLGQYGHSIYDLDFAKPLPLDEPQPLLEALKLFIRDDGPNPHKRQQNWIERRVSLETAIRSRVKGLKRRLFDWTLSLARRFGLMREDSIYDIGLGYPILRQMLLTLGEGLVRVKDLTTPEDIYWMTWTELELAVAEPGRNPAVQGLADRIRERKAVWQAEKRVIPPPQLPPKGRIMGINADAFMPVRAEEQTGAVIKGVAASPGRVTANACLLLGPDDFYKMKPGDILVAEVTTPAWTPLFAMASGVVTDIGGPLSHGSIVAREYGIPAVLGTGVATQRIHHEQVIRVDGSEGTVSLNEG